MKKKPNLSGLVKKVSNMFATEKQIRKMDISERQKHFLEEYKASVKRWGLDLTPAFQFVDVFAIEDAKVVAEAKKNEEAQ